MHRVFCMTHACYECLLVVQLLPQRFFDTRQQRCAQPAANALRLNKTRLQ